MKKEGDYIVTVVQPTPSSMNKVFKIMSNPIKVVEENYQQPIPIEDMYTESKAAVSIPLSIKIPRTAINSRQRS